jgi:hypothetical protein
VNARRLPLLLALPVLALCGACAPKQEPIYRWGRYEDLVYDMYARPGKSDPGTQIAKLTEDIERAAAEGKLAPPGVHAHLAFLYYSQGQLDLAAAEFAAERQLFPESAVFVDGILARMKKGAKLATGAKEAQP